MINKKLINIYFRISQSPPLPWFVLFNCLINIKDSSNPNAGSNAIAIPPFPISIRPLLG